MTRIIFLCTGNTCRSQMAEGFADDLGKGIIEACSGGLIPAGSVHPLAVAVMKETGIDISGQKSKGIDPELLETMDIIVTLCGNEEASCPVTPPSIKRIHWPIDDPVAAVGTEDEIMNEFRKARDIIRENILELIRLLQSGEKT